MLAVIRTMGGDGLRGGGKGVGEEGIGERERGGGALAENQAEGRTSAAGQVDSILKAEGV